MSIFNEFVLEDCTAVDEYGIRWMKMGLGEKDFLRTRWKLRRTHPSAREYLQEHADKFSWGRFCLQYGQNSRAESYRIVRDRLNRHGTMEAGRCYYNAMHLLRNWLERRPEWIGDRSISYVEGLALDPTGVFLHAWIDIDGNAYDVTLPGSWMISYFGVRFEPMWADGTMERIGQYGLFHWWERSRPYLEDFFSPT